VGAPGPEQITGYVLAGGESRRMGGIHKALVEHSGQPLYQYAVANLQACCDRVLINTHRDQAVFREAGFCVVEDGEFQGCGPVAGVHAALSHATTPFVAIAACDQLTLPKHVYQTLALEVSEKIGVYAYSLKDIVPTCAVLPTSLKVQAHHALTSSHRALMAFMRAHARPIRFDQVDFANLNDARQVTPT